MAKQLNVNLAFGADTSKAKQAIMDLQTSLSKVVTTGSINVDDAKMRQAAEAAKELSIHLNNAFNANTGKLDLSKLDKSLKNSSTSMSQLSSKLLEAGTEGQAAFVKLAQNIAAAERPVVTLNSKLNEMLTTLKNTARWQISSSILHGFMGAIQSAHGYAKDLNKSLNDIRIVTGYDTDAMAQFAVEANKAAKALSTTTTEYTNASLIYFQQGLTNNQVEERTAVTIKMANAAGESAKEVSDQLTAVWNNFYDGSKSLEYYADVMTALGAATASSTDEISEGLNKFAAIAETVGLSYEYAASALATVTATTRQSADVVGTAFKTLFARLQDLELSETLDDGTTLGKYSAALNTVGINIKDVNGDMKDMDQILNELGSKWQSLSKETQVALAQTVAGTRQYTQLVALMDNWDYFQENLGVAKTSEGTLDEQAEIYAESWEAARDRVKASAEAIYDQLLDDKFFIDLSNGFSSLLDSINAFIDGAGGLKTVLISIGSIFLSQVANKIAPALKNLKDNFAVVFSSAEKQAQKLAIEMNTSIHEALKKSEDGTGPKLSDSSVQALKNAEILNTAKAKLQAVENNLTATEKQRFEYQLSIIQLAQEEAQSLADSVQAHKDKISSLQEEWDLTAAINNAGKNRDKEEATLNKIALNKKATYLENPTGANLGAYNEATKQLNAHRVATEEALLTFERYITILQQGYGTEMEATKGVISHSEAMINVSSVLDGYIEKVEVLGDSLRSKKSSFTEVKNEIAELKSQVELASGGSLPELTAAFDRALRAGNSKQLSSALQEIETQLKNAQIPAKDLEKILTKLGQGKTIAGLQKEYKNLNKSTKDLTEKQNRLNKAFEDFEPKHTVKGIEQITQAAAGLGQVAMLAQSFRSIIDALNNDDLSFGEKLLTTFTGIAMIVPGAVGAFNSFNTALGLTAKAQQANALSTLMNASASEILTSKITAEQIAKTTGLSIDEATLLLNQLKAKAMLEEAQANGVLGGARMKKMLVEKMGISADQASLIMSKMKAGASFTEAAAQAGVTLAKTGSIGAAITHTVALTAETLAAMGLNAALTPLLAVMLLLVAAIASIVAIGAIVVGVFKAIKNSTPEAKLKAAEEEASRLSEELTKAKDAANELRESIESYDTAIEKIKTLKEGTEEWRKAIQEANDIARQMIDENEGLEGKYHFNAETGLIEFDKEALADLQASADSKVRTVEGQKIRADNAVLSAKNAVSIKEASKNENKNYAEMAHSVGKRNSLFKTDFEGVLNMVDPASWTQAGTQMLSQAIQDKMQQSALDELTKAYAENGGNFAEAMDGLTNMQKRLIKSMDLTDSELSALCQEVKNNTDAAHENTKQLIHNNLSGDYDYDTSEYKDFIADIMATDLDAESERLYKEKYKDGSGMTDKEAQRAYAEMMGWDANLVDNQGGNKAVYINEEGEEVTISDEQVRRALAQAEAQNTITSQSEGYIRQANQLANIEKDITANLAGPSGNVSMDNYDEYVKQVKEQAKEQGLNLSDDEIEKFIAQNGSNTRTASQMTLKKSLSSLGEFDDKNMIQFIENISKDLSDEELELAVDIAASAESIDDFARKFEQAATQAFIDSLQSSAQQAQSILNAGAETGKINSDDLIALGEDETFRAYLEEQGETLVSLTASTYAEKMTIISGYYNKLKALEADALETNKQNYQADLASYEAILQYKEAYDALQKNPEDENAQETMDKLHSNFKDINFSAYMDMDVSDIHAKIDEIENNIEEIEAKKISLNIEWETTEAIETNLKSISGLSKAFENDMSKVGDSYQMTAAQMREWAQQYPDLFKQAKATSDGLMEIDAAVVENYINGQEAEAKATIEANIQMLEANKTKLQSDYNNLLAEKEMALSGVKLEEITAEQMMSIKQKLTQYYIDCGMDEVSANQAALKQMGIDQDTYNSFVGESMSGMITTADSAAEGTYRAFSNLWERVKSIFKNLKEAWQALWKGDFESFGKNIGESFTAAWKGVDPEDYIPKIITTPESLNLNTPLKYTATAEMSDLDNISALYDEELNTITKQMDSINAEIEYNKALLTQNLSDFGNVDIGVDKQDEIESLDDMIERYKELNEALEENKDAMDDASKAADRLYGSARLKEMQKVNKELQKEIALLDKKKIEAENYLIKDKEVLKQTVEEANSLFGADLQLSFDADGSITNYTAIMNTLIAIYDAKVKEFGEERSDQERALLDALQARIDAFQNAIDQYDETRSTIRDIDNQRQDAFNEWQDNNYEQLTYTLEVELEINDDAMQDLEYQLNKLGEDAYGLAEAIGLMINGFSESGQLGIYLDNLAQYENHKNALDADYAAGRISQADYVAGLREVQDGIYENLEALNELDKAMLEYYGNTLAAAREEIDKYTEAMAHQRGVIEHYMSLMDLFGKSTDYKTIGKILDAQAQTLEDQAKVAKATMDMMQTQAEERRVAYEEALKSGDEAMIELYQQQYEDALAAAREAQDAYLSSAEEWAESLKTILENKLADLGQTLEDALTGGTSFDQLTTSMERAASLQEEYLTSTNQIYETTKMMRTAQQEIDKTTNSVAKRKIANFIQETKQLQNQSKLSQYELDIQQAKYDLLLAEIALEESKNAKSTVRLQRDAEGNFGYVYTADSSAIADATQKYEDAQNALYNIGLEGTADYTQKYQQTLNEMYDTITDLQNQYLSGAFGSEEEYNKAVMAAKEYYYAKLQEYSSLYSVAISADTRVIADSWTTGFTEMMDSTEDWKIAVNDYIGEAAGALSTWKSAVDGIAKDTGTALGSLETNLLNVTNQSDALATAITGSDGVINSLEEVLDTVIESTDDYAELRSELQLLAEQYQATAQEASAFAAAQAKAENTSFEPPEEKIDYAQLLQDTLAEMYEELANIEEKWADRSVEEDAQYNAEMEAAKKEYYDKLKEYSTEYREALNEDSTLIEEDWFAAFEAMINDTALWNEEVEKYLESVRETIKALGEESQTTAGKSSEALDTLKDSIFGVTEKVLEMTKAFNEQNSILSRITDYYNDLYWELEKVADGYRDMASAAQAGAPKTSSTGYYGGSGGGGGKAQVTQAIFDDNSFIGLDTGGYTGQWGSYGKLAMLHEKELVLNKEDTENLLASMGILNSILQTIDLQSANAQIGGILTTPNFHGGGNDMLEQNVHIEASFPNVQNSNDIEEAFNNLINRASQYANRK